MVVRTWEQEQLERPQNFFGCTWIGFDVDNALVRYRIPELTKLVWTMQLQYLVRYENYDESLLHAEYDRYVQLALKGVVLDNKLGNILRIDQHGYVSGGAHGSRRLDASEISRVYSDMIPKWDPTTKLVGSSERFLPCITYFDIPLASVFAAVVDHLDAKSESSSHDSYSNVVKALMRGLTHNYGSFENRGWFFPAITAEPEKYMYKLSPFMRQWLVDLRQIHGRRLFLLSNSLPAYMDMMMKYVLGDDWADYFDICIASSGKAGFFKDNSVPYLSHRCLTRDGLLNELYHGSEYRLWSKGNGTTLLRYFEEADPRTPSICYIGDHIKSDVVAAKLAWPGCRAIAIVEEMGWEDPKHPHHIHDHSIDEAPYADFFGSFFHHNGIMSNLASALETEFGADFVVPSIQSLMRQCLPPYNIE